MTTFCLIDMGNTSTRVALYDAAGIQNPVSIPTKALSQEHLKAMIPADAVLVVSSVVPDKDKVFTDAFDRVHFVSYKNIPKLTLNLEAPEQVGADRLVTALAGFEYCKSSCVVIDSGTAITFCYVDKAGCYQGGAILPGLKIASQSLNDYTAKIPLIYVEPQESMFGKTTQQAVQIGLFQGYKHLITGMIQAYKTIDPEITVIGTGSGLQVYDGVLPIDVFIEDLVVQGLKGVADNLGLSQNANFCVNTHKNYPHLPL